MAEESQQTSPNTNPEGTDDGNQTPPAATQPQGQSGAATDDDEVVTLKKSDYNNLVSQRDSNHNRAAATEQYVMEMAQKEDIKGFLSDPANAGKFPDVEVEDLMDATSPEDFEKLAGQTQARIDKAANRRLADIQKVEAPALSPDEKAAQLKKLKAQPGSKSFQKMLELEQAPTS